MEIKVDKRRILVTPGDYDKTIVYCVDHFVQLATSAIADHGLFFVALSGGSTPKAIFNLLSSPTHKNRLDWTKVHLFWSDERCVGPEHPESNYKMAMDAGLSGVGIPKDHIHRIKGEKEPEQAALEYEAIIHHLINGHGFDLIMLGMGDDGHTASLFPGTGGLLEKKRDVIANHVPQKNTTRITMTFKIINQAHHAVFYVLGESKGQMLLHVLQGDDLPSSHVGTVERPARFIADQAAAASFLKMRSTSQYLKSSG